MSDSRSPLLWEVRGVPDVTDDAFKRFLKLPPRREFTGALAEAATEARAWYAQHGRPWGAAAPAARRIDRPLHHPRHRVSRARRAACRASSGTRGVDARPHRHARRLQ